MNKKIAEAVAIIVIIGVVSYPFVWIYNQIGAAGSVLGIVGLIGIATYWKTRNKKKDQESFDALVLYTLHNRISYNEAKNINLSLAKNNFPRAALIRNLQIIRDSIEIALLSKKRETAESRAKTISDLHQEINAKQAGLVSINVRREIDSVCTEALKEFNTKLYLNIANGHVEKAQSLKTNKSKIKYLNLASEVLKEGVTVGRGDIDMLKNALKNISAQKASLVKNM